MDLDGGREPAEQPNLDHRGTDERHQRNDAERIQSLAETGDESKQPIRRERSGVAGKTGVWRSDRKLTATRGACSEKRIPSRRIRADVVFVSGDGGFSVHVGGFAGQKQAEAECLSYLRPMRVRSAGNAGAVSGVWDGCSKRLNNSRRGITVNDYSVRFIDALRGCENPVVQELADRAVEAHGAMRIDGTSVGGHKFYITTESGREVTIGFGEHWRTHIRDASADFPDQKPFANVIRFLVRLVLEEIMIVEAYKNERYVAGHTQALGEKRRDVRRANHYVARSWNGRYNGDSRAT